MVYVFKLKGYDYYKIGIAINVKKRLKDIDRINPFGVEYIKSYETLYDKGVEGNLHNHFKDKWIKGEWFELTEDDVNSIDELVILYNKPQHRKYIKPIKKKESMVELANKVVEVYEANKIGNGTMNFQKTLKKGEKILGDSDRIVGNILNISKNKVRSLRKLHEHRKDLLEQIDEGKMSLFFAYELYMDEQK